VQAGLGLLLALAPRVSSAQVGVSGTATASLFVHQVDVGYGVEESTGLVFGAEGAVAWRSRLVLALRAGGGSLSTQAMGAENRKVGEIGVRASIAAARWLALLGGATSRVYSTAIARQRWTTVDLGAEARLDFATIPVRAVLRGGVLPVVSVHGLPGPDVALCGAAGLEYRGGPVTGAAFYELERYDFPDAGAGRRLEQVSRLSFRVTVQRSARRVTSGERR